jgi:predicted S18 family serine protease
MNDENYNKDADETAEMREALIAELQQEVEQLQEESDAQVEALMVANGRIAELETSPLTKVVIPAGDDELRALAATIRTALRNGHPDAMAHVDTLLGKLGA